jgi:hypothetical protein
MKLRLMTQKTLIQLNKKEHSNMMPLICIDCKKPKFFHFELTELQENMIGMLRKVILIVGFGLLKFLQP